MKAEVQRMVTDCADSLKQMDQYNVIKQALAPMIQVQDWARGSYNSLLIYMQKYVFKILV